MAHSSGGTDGAASERWNRITRQLSAAPRRYILIALSEATDGQQVPIEDAVEPAAVSTSAERLEVQLQHRHLPMLADAGYVEWTDEPMSVRRGPNFDEVEAVLEALFDAADDLPSELVNGCTALENHGGAV